MNDALFVRRSQPMSDLQGVIQSLPRRKRSAPQSFAQGFALEEFGNHVRRAFVGANVENRQNIILGWFRAAVASASCSNRCSRSESSESACGRTLIATSRFSRESRAR